MAETDCIFCRIAAGSIPASVVLRTDSALVFKDLAPQAPTHLLVIPARHVDSLASDDDAQELGHLMTLAARAAREAGLEADGYRVVTNVGEQGGQTVQHLHLHVLGGRHMHWPPG